MAIPPRYMYTNGHCIPYWCICGLFKWRRLQRSCFPKGVLKYCNFVMDFGCHNNVDSRWMLVLLVPFASMNFARNPDIRSRETKKKSLEGAEWSMVEYGKDEHVGMKFFLLGRAWGKDIVHVMEIYTVKSKIVCVICVGCNSCRWGQVVVSSIIYIGWKSRTVILLVE